MSRTTYYDTDPSEGDPFDDFDDPYDDLAQLDPHNKFIELELMDDNSLECIAALSGSEYDALVDLESVIACDSCYGVCVFVKGAPYQICTMCLDAQYRHQINVHTLNWYEERFRVLLEDPSFTFSEWFDKPEKQKPETAAIARPAVTIIDEILDRMDLDSLTEGV